MCLSNSRRSSDEETETNTTTTAAEGKVNSTIKGQIESIINTNNTTTTTTESVASISVSSSSIIRSSQNNNDNDSQLSRQSCYDSGIDICDSNIIPIVQPIPTKKVYSDADIVLSSDWVPPRTISPTHVSESPPRSQGSTHSGSTLSQTQSLDTTAGIIGGGGGVGNRKKTSSVSFSVDDNEQSQSSQSSEKSSDQNKKNKVKFLWYDFRGN